MGILRLTLAPVVLLALFRLAAAAPQPADAERPPWLDPQRMFEQLFGAQGEVDERILGEIQVPAKEERQIGRSAVEAYLASLKSQGTRVVNRGRDVQYLRILVDKLHPMLEHRARYRSIQIYLVLSDRIDARSFPGGYLVFFQGLLDKAGNEAALIGIVGHELSHLDRGHHTRRIKEMKLAQRTFSGQPMAADRFPAVGGVLMRSWLRPFRADLEREADLDGARWSYLAGYDCREMGKLFARLEQQERNVPFAIPEFFRSHPAGPDRQRAIVEQYRKLQLSKPNPNLRIGTEGLRARGGK